MLDVRTPSVEHRWRTCADRKPGASGTAAASRKSQHRGLCAGSWKAVSHVFSISPTSFFITDHASPRVLF